MGVRMQIFKSNLFNLSIQCISTCFFQNTRRNNPRNLTINRNDKRGAADDKRGADRPHSSADISLSIPTNFEKVGAKRELPAARTGL